KLASLPATDTFAHAAGLSNSMDVPHVIGAASPAVPTNTPPAVRVVGIVSETRTTEIGGLVSTLRTETRSQNYPQAREAADRLEELLTQNGVDTPGTIWKDSHRALFDFELFVQVRIESSGGVYDLTRLK